MCAIALKRIFQRELTALGQLLDCVFVDKMSVLVASVAGCKKSGDRLLGNWSVCLRILH